MARVLIVEDEALIVSDLSRCLQTAGYEVVGNASNGIEAIELIEALSPDVVLLDIKLQGAVDGIEIGAQIFDRWDVPVIFITAMGDERTMRRAQTARPGAYLVKPFKDCDLLAALVTVLCQHDNTFRIPPAEQAFALGIQSNGNSSLSISDQAAHRHQMLAKVPFLKELSHEELSFLALGCLSVDLRGGQDLFPDKNSELNPFIVTRGLVGLFSGPTTERAVISALIPSYDALGLVAAFDSSQTCRGARALCPTSILVAPKAVVLSLIERHPFLGRHLAEALSARLQEAHKFSGSLLGDRAETRVRHALSSLLPHFKDPSKSKDTVVVWVSRRELAALSGLTLETTVRVLKTLQQAGTVDLAHRRFIEVLQPQALVAGA